MINVSKPNRDCQTENQKDPIELWNVYLTTEPFRFMYNFDTRETTYGIALFHDRECGRDYRLASDDCSQSCHHKNWPKQRIYKHGKNIP